MLKVDAHQHFWIFDPRRDQWITEDMEIIRCNFLPDDLKPILAENAISACVAIQADQSEHETRFLLDLAEKNSFIKGVIGWVDLQSPDLPDRLSFWKTYPSLKGFRHVIQAEQPGFMDIPEFSKGLGALTSYGFTYDILIKSSQLKEASRLIKSHPAQKFVLDHLGKPPIKDGEIQSWASDIKELARNENVYCKISGLITEAIYLDSEKTDFKPYLDVALESFGVDRLMFGSDWPVCRLAAEYGDVCEVVTSYLENLSVREQELVWSANAIKFYGLNIN